MRVLIIEDQEELAQTVAAGLRREAMAVDVATDGVSGLDRARVYDYDVIVLDRDLPLLHGDRVCSELVREGVRARVLMLTAAAAVEDRVDGLGLGADDYLSKPFAFAELVARVRALTRRAQRSLPPVLVRGELELDSGQRTVRRGGRRVDLSAKEFAVLELLMAAEGGVVSAEQLLERAWDEAADPFSNVVKVTVSRLRRKLSDEGGGDLIETVSGAGYRI
jgi:DNA-binding response OmpR family regulator